MDKYFPGNMGLIDGWRLVGFRFSMRVFKEMKEEFFKFRVVNSKFI
jgi:hypothetical protein